MTEQLSPIGQEMAGSWIGDVRGALVANAFVETTYQNGDLSFDIRINISGNISKLTGILRRDVPPIVDLKVISSDPKANLTGTIRFDQFLPQRMSGKWEFSNGAAGIINLQRMTTSAVGSPSPLQAAELISKETILPSVTLYKRDLEALVQRIGSLLPPPAKVVVTAEIDRRKVVQFSENFLGRHDLPRHINEITLNITDGGQPFAKTIAVILSTDQSKVITSSDSATWTIGAYEDVRNVLSRNIGWARSTYQKHGLLINSIIVLAMIIVVPDLKLLNRAAFVIFVVGILFALLKLHTATTRTTIYLDDTARGIWAKEIPTAVTGLLAAGAAWLIAHVYDYLATTPLENLLRVLPH